MGSVKSWSFSRFAWLLAGLFFLATPEVFAEQDGGDSSGGGDVIASEVLPAEQLNIFAEVSELRPLIAAHLNWLKKHYQVEESRKAEWEMLFGNHDRNIFAVRAGAKKIWLSKDSCFFGDGFNHRDSSIRFDADTGKNAEICLSEPRLKARYKANPHKFRRELIALMIHEYSHAAKFNEDQADWLQKLSLELLNHQGISLENHYPVMNSGLQDVSQIFQAVRGSISWFKDMKTPDLGALDLPCKKLIEVQGLIQDFRLPAGPFIFFEQGEKNPLFGLYESLSVIKHRQCGRLMVNGHLPSQLDRLDQVPKVQVTVRLDPVNLKSAIRHLQNLRGTYRELAGPFRYHEPRYSAESVGAYKRRIERDWSLENLLGN